ncbi:helix-hairpin-helix domain-containing protein [Zhihengliuella halotolerans]|uniref:Helix-hairpin-helix protein n=1 Tax=Zhihengliuella halotolerans TaxID=370736 RepID=A0A4V2G9L4_9MICC|nr:helix-hairpin-helix domain-containing protein [Zhihengliuella halotolerans]RZU60816.1 helix-hairpin-helix protein [Zhihengliuella halotolerans]
MTTPDVRPVGDLPNELGKTAPRELLLAGIDSLAKISEHSERELLAVHGVGPKAIRILRAALADRGLTFSDDIAETAQDSSVH